MKFSLFLFIANITIMAISQAINVDYNKKTRQATQKLRNELERKTDGHYSFSYAISNGMTAHESGEAGVVVQGSNYYISPEGIEIKTSYIADDTGYHPVGTHIPKIPDYILRALEYIRDHPYQVKDYYTGETKTVSRNHVAFKAVTHNTLVPLAAKTAPVNKYHPITSNSSNNNDRGNIPSHQRHRRHSIKYYYNIH